MDQLIGIFAAVDDAVTRYKGYALGPEIWTSGDFGDASWESFGTVLFSELYWFETGAVLSGKKFANYNRVPAGKTYRCRLAATFGANWLNIMNEGQTEIYFGAFGSCDTTFDFYSNAVGFSARLEDPGQFEMTIFSLKEIFTKYFEE